MAQYQTPVNNLLRNQPVTAPVSGTAYTALQTDRFIDITASAAFALTLPAPATSGATANVGHEYTIKDVAGNAATFNITITPASGLIDGAASLVLANNYDSVNVVSDGTNYWITAEANVPSLLPWTNVSGTSTTMSANNGYYATNAGLVTLTLPATIAAGSIIEVLGVGSGLWKIAQLASQSIQFGNAVSTVGTGGSLSSSAIGDNVRLLCTTANLVFYVLDGSGNILIT